MYAGIDLGTSEVKVVLLDDEGKLVASAGERLDVSRPQPGWSEQHPHDWWHATGQAMAKLRSQAPAAFAAVKAIGLSGQMHGAVLLDKHNRVLRPAILWNDLRSVAECDTLTQAAPGLHTLAGNLAMPGFTAPKLLWVARYEPDIFAATHTVLLPKDYLRLCMTGDKASDTSDASGTLWLDVGTRTWSAELLQATGLSTEHMPTLVEGPDITGTLLPAVARAWGLGADVIVAGGAGDGAASAIGIGAVEPGDGFLSLGTSGVMFVVTDQFRPNPASALHTFCHALPGRWNQMSVMLAAASCLRWFCQLTSTEEHTLLQEIEQLSPQARHSAPIFLPYLSGERTPHNDPFAPGVFWGLNQSHGRAALGYAILEGVSFGMMDGLDALHSAGTRPHSLSLVGGGARSPFWAQLLADALNLTITTHIGSEAGGALGAARLGWLAAGGQLQYVCQRPPVKAEHQPDITRHQALQPRLQLYRDIYQQRPPTTLFR